MTDCADPFKTGLMSFVAALDTAGATTTINATYRPPERAYLMHWGWMIVHGRANVTSIPAMAGVGMQWDHDDQTQSTAAAQAMVDGYGMGGLRTPPALNSKHTARLAVDMNISWTDTLSIVDNAENTVAITSTPRTGMNADFHAVGASYGVIKFTGGERDRPHWSDAGD